MSYANRTITRLRRLIGVGLTIEPTEPASDYYHRITLGDVVARGHVGDGFITFQVRPVGFVEGRFDGGRVVVPAPKMERRRALFAAWFVTVHARAAEEEREGRIRSAAWLAAVDGGAALTNRPRPELALNLPRPFGHLSPNRLF